MAEGDLHDRSRRAWAVGAGARLHPGWVMLLTLSVTEMISWGILYYAFTIFLTPMEAELGWSRAALVGAFSLAVLISGVAGLAVGRWLDRHGPRALMTAGSVAAALLVLAWAAVTDLLAFYLIWAALGLALAAVLYEPAFWLVAVWFRRERGRALTVLTFIAGFASVIFLPLTDWLVRAQGWRGALVTLALLLAAGTILPHALVLRRHPRDLGLGPDGRPADEAAAPDTTAAAGTAERSVTAGAALRSPGFWRLSLAFFLATLGVGALFVHLVPYLIDQGYDPAFAAWTVGMIGLMGLPGRLIFTPLGDVLPRRLVTALLFALQAVALLVLLVWRTPAGVLAFVALFGAGFGAITPARAALLAETYGPAHYGRINGVQALALTGARALAPVGAGLLAAWMGGYEPVFWALLAGSVVAAVAVLPPDRGG